MEMMSRFNEAALHARTHARTRSEPYRDKPSILLPSLPLLPYADSNNLDSPPTVLRAFNARVVTGVLLRWLHL